MFGKTKLVAALMMIGLAVGMYTATSAPAGASAAPSAEKKAAVGATANQTFKNEKYKWCMTGVGGDVKGYSPCHGGKTHQWSVKRWNDGTVRLRNADTSECLTDKGGKLTTVKSCDSSKAQSFFVDRWNDGTIRFRNQGSGQCVKMAKPSGDFADVGSTTCDKSESQSWY